MKKSKVHNKRITFFSPSDILKLTRFDVGVYCQSFIYILLACYFTVIGASAYANVDSSVIKGNITKPAGDGVVEITITDVDSGYSVQRQVEGQSYKITDLSPGRYQLTFAIEQLEVKSEVVVLGLNQQAEFDVTFPDNNNIEEVIVIGKQVVDRFTSEIGTSLSPELLDALPQASRNFLSAVDLAPGVVTSTDADGNISFRSGAQRSSAVNVYIDGVSQKDYVLAGGISGQDSSRGNPFPQSAIAEYKVISSNFKAEFDQVSSAGIIAVTKRGGNEWHGGLFADYSDSDLRAKVPNEKLPGAMQADTKQKQYGLWSSGPIRKNKLHYYVSFERKENKDLRELTPGGPLSLRDNLPLNLQNAIAGNQGAFTSDFEQNLFLFKLNWDINDKHHVEYSFKGRQEDELTGIGDRFAKETAVRNKSHESRIGLSHEYRGDMFFNKAILTYEDISRNPFPVRSTAGEAYSYAPTRNGVEEILFLGGGRDYQDKGQAGWGFQNDLTFTEFSWLGYHTVKTGFKAKALELSGIEINPVNVQVFYSVDTIGFDFANDASTILPAVPYRAEFTRPVTSDTPLVESNLKRFGAYIQDEWLATDRLTLDIGIRWDYEENPLYLDYQTPQDLVAALRGNSGISNPNAGYDINDYISTGDNRESFKGAWAPRLGFSYSINDEGKHMLFGGYGRSYNRIQFDFIQLEASRERFSRFNVNFSGPHQFDCNAPCIAFDPSFLEPGANASIPVQGSREVFALNKKLKDPYSDQFTLGLRSQLGEWWSSELGLNRTESRDGFVFLLGNRREEGRYYPEGFQFSNAPFGVNVSDQYSNLLLGANGADTNTDSIYIKLDKAKLASAWSFNATYTWSDSEENVRFGGPFNALDPMPGFFGFLPSGGVNEHVLVAAFTYELPLQIQFATKLNLRSGEPFYGQRCRSFAPDICEPAQDYIKKEDFIIPNAWGYRQVDFALSKNFTLPNQKGGIYLRMDVLNAFDHENFVPGNDRFIGPLGNPNFGRPEGNIVGLPRTIKLSAGYNF